MDVSIIIPVYQVAPYIADCLQSVMRQTYTGEMECLLVDDCGTDESISIGERLIAEYTGPVRFEILHHEYHRGLSAARNTGTLHAKGEYIYYLDSDDYITDDCIEKMMARALSDPDIELVQGNSKLYEKTAPNHFYTRSYPKIITRSNDEVRSFSLHHDWLPVNAWNKLVKRSFIFAHKFFFKEGVLYEDILWRFYLIKYLSCISFIEDITYVHRRRSGSIMTGTSNEVSAYNRHIVYQDIITNLTEGHEREEIAYYGSAYYTQCLSFASFHPAMKETLQLYFEKARQLKYYSFPLKCMRRAFGYMLSQNKVGHFLWAFLLRLKHPRLIPNDFHRLRGYIKRQRASQA